MAAEKKEVALRPAEQAVLDAAAQGLQASGGEPANTQKIEVTVNQYTDIQNNGTVFNRPGRRRMLTNPRMGNSPIDVVTGRE